MADTQYTIKYQYLLLSNMIRLFSFTFAVLSGLAVLTVNSTIARAETEAELAKKLSNPIASLISVPFQFNFDSGYGTANGSLVTVNIQPVIPFSLNDDWNLISRTIIPVKYQHDLFGMSGSQFGLGDTVQSLWISPKEPTPSGIIWGAGPVIYLPTATDSRLGAGEWGAGPTALALTQKGPWTIGGLTNHIWSFDNGSTINSTFVQPFLTYTTPTAWTFALNTEATYNWNSNEWSVPVNASVSKLVNFNGQPVSFQAGVGYYAASTTGGADGWRARFAVTFLFPK